MIGEDAVNSTTAMLEKLMQIILEIIRMQRDSQRYNSREAAKSSKENAKQPKIKFGEMKTEYKKMLNAGDKMHRIEVDKNQLEGLNKIAKEIGAKYWVMSTEGNTASVIVPEKFFVQMQGALRKLPSYSLLNRLSHLLYIMVQKSYQLRILIWLRQCLVIMTFRRQPLKPMAAT